MTNEHTNKQSDYNIKIQGQLDDCWKEWFDDLDIILTPDGDTILSGTIIDQSALHGVLKKISNLGLTLISVNPHAQQDKEKEL